MKIENYCTLEFPSRSANEGFARAGGGLLCRPAGPHTGRDQRRQDGSE